MRIKPTPLEHACSRSGTNTSAVVERFCEVYVGAYHWDFYTPAARRDTRIAVREALEKAFSQDNPFLPLRIPGRE